MSWKPRYNKHTLRTRGCIILLTTGVLAAAPAGFEKSVQPVLTTTCAPCHNAKLTSGGLNVATLTSPGSLSDERDVWEKVLRKVRSGQMPPKGVPRPEAEIGELVKFVEAELERSDRN